MAVAVRRDSRGRVIVPPRDPHARRRPLREPVHTMIRDLSRDHGKCFATEQGLRRELYRRLGYVCGERSIGRVIQRSVRRGELGKERIKPYHRRVDGDRHHPGTTHTWIVVRREQRKARRRIREADRQAKYRAARAERDRFELEQHAREQDALERAARAMHSESYVAALPPSVGQIIEALTKPSTSADEPTAADLERRRRDRVAEQLAALERAGFDVPKKPPDA